jgi:hypothetical protein
MYPAVNNSPIAALTAALSVSDTVIPLNDVSRLPAAPNIATLGEDDNAELVYYAAIDAAAKKLTNCARGHNGTMARVWALGDPVYRAYTTYDHNAFKANIEDLAATKANATALPSASNILPIASGGTGRGTASAALTALGGVPATRKVNGKALSVDVTLAPADVGAPKLPTTQTANQAIALDGSGAIVPAALPPVIGNVYETNRLIVSIPPSVWAEDAATGLYKGIYTLTVTSAATAVVTVVLSAADMTRPLLNAGEFTGNKLTLYATKLVDTAISATVIIEGRRT